MELTTLNDEQKIEVIDGFVKITAENALPLFKILNLKTHFECVVEDEKTGEKYKLSFVKL